jgi:multiple sugar transport system substrate-binding protein
MNIQRFIALSFIVLLLMAAGCSRGLESVSGDTVKNPEDSAKPITIRVLHQFGNFTEEEYKNLIIEPVKKTYPNIDVQVSLRDPKRTLENYLTAGDFPDIVLTAHPFLDDYIKLNSLQDLSPYIQKYNMDLARFDPEAIKEIKYFGKNNEVYAIPFSIQTSALYYNKDIFDNFGLDYPKDGMSWSDIIDLSNKLGSRSGGKTKSVNMLSIVQFSSPLSLPYVDLQAFKPNLVSDQWRQAFTMYKQLTDIPGNRNQDKGGDAFLKAQNLAMLADYGGRIDSFEQLRKEGHPMNWDLAAYPHFNEAPDYGLSLEAMSFMISSTSKHKDEAFKIIQLLTNKDHLLYASRNGRFPAVNDPEMQKVYGQNIEELKGKNVQAFFKSKPAPSTRIYDNSRLIESIVRSAVDKFADGGGDVNTILRDAQEQATKTINEKNAK